MGEAGGEGDGEGAAEYYEGNDWQGGKRMGAAKGGLGYRTGGTGGDLAWWVKEVSGCVFGVYLGLGIEQAMLGKQQTHCLYRTAYSGLLIYKLPVCRQVINLSIS
jgi:hypothetical protein